jgi:PAS domain-containing protein
MTAPKGIRPALRLVEGAASHAAPWAWFCGHCAAPSPGDVAPAPSARVCRACGLGLLLETRVDAVPTERDAFVVIDNALLVQAVSRRAQALLAVTEEEAVNRPISDLLMSADAEAQGSRLSAAIAEAADGSSETTSTFVRPWNTFGVRIRARITPCGPPRAALLVLDSPRQPRLRAVD